MTSNADLLREAAALMRRDAAAEAILREGDPYFDEPGEATRYERAWRPAVALAVADWLDREAAIPTWHDQQPHPKAVAVARAYLGRDGG